MIQSLSLSSNKRKKQWYHCWFNLYRVEIINIYKQNILAEYSMETTSISFLGKCTQEGILYIWKQWLKSEEVIDRFYCSVTAANTILLATAELLLISTFFVFQQSYGSLGELKSIGNKPAYFSSLSQTTEK